MRRLAVLRPEPGASETVERARAIGLEAQAMPLFEVRPLPWAAPDPGSFDGLLVTSANAIRHGGPELAKFRGLAVHAVGKASADVARKAGFAIATVGDSGVEELLAALPGGMRLLHLSGEDVREPNGASQKIVRIPVYRSAALPPPDGLKKVEGAVAALHSPRAANRFAELVEECRIDKSQVRIAAISKAALEAAGAGWEMAEAAERPDDESLLALAARLCEKSGT